MLLQLAKMAIYLHGVGIKLTKITLGNSQYFKLGHKIVTDAAVASGHEICMLPAKVDLPEPCSQVVCEGILDIFSII